MSGLASLDTLLTYNTWLEACTMSLCPSTHMSEKCKTKIEEGYRTITAYNYMTVVINDPHGPPKDRTKRGHYVLHFTWLDFKKSWRTDRRKIIIIAGHDCESAVWIKVRMNLIREKFYWPTPAPDFLNLVQVVAVVANIIQPCHHLPVIDSDAA